MNEQNGGKTSTLGQVLNRWWFWVGLTVIGFMVLLLLLLPVGIEYGGEKLLESQGASQTIIEDVDFNPFTGKLVVKDFHMEADDGGVLSIHEATLKFDWIPLFGKTVQVGSLVVKDASMTMEYSSDGQFTLSGLTVPVAREVAAEPGEAPWGFSLVQLEVHNSQIREVFPHLELISKIDFARMSRFSTRDKEEAAHFEWEGTLNDSEIRVQADFYPFADEPNVNGTLEMTRFSMAAFDEFLGPDLKGLKGKLSMNGKFELRKRADGSVSFRKEGTTKLEEFHIEAGGVDVTESALSWDGSISGVKPKDSDGPQISAKGHLKGGSLSITMQQEGMRYRHEGMDWKGPLAYGEQMAPKGERSLKIDDLHIDNPKRLLSFLQIRTVDFQGITAAEVESIRVSRIQLDDIRLVQDLKGEKDKRDKGNNPFLVAAKTMTLENLDLKNLGELAIDTVDLHGVDAAVRRDREGRWVLVENLSTGSGTGEPAKEDGKQKGFPLRIGKIQILGKSQLRFDDESVKPPYRMKLELNEASLTNLDSNKPDQPSDLILAGKVNKYAQLDFKGYVKPFGDGLSMKVNGRIEGLSLPPFSSYTAQTIGYNLSSGQLEADIDCKADQGQLEGKSELVANNLTVDQADPAVAAEFEKKLTVSFPTALSMLQDDKDNIKLAAPISGDISNPEFGLGDAFQQAIVKAVRFSAINVLKYMLQPYGAAIAVGQYALEQGAEMVTGVSLDPVLFIPGSKTLDDDAIAYLEPVAKLMKERSQVRIKICGKATAADRAVLEGKPLPTLQDQTRLGEKGQDDGAVMPSSQVTDSQLQALARQRSAVVKQHLVEKHGIEPDRLFLCHPEVDTDEEGKPRADLLI